MDKNTLTLPLKKCQRSQDKDKQTIFTIDIFFIRICITRNVLRNVFQIVLLLSQKFVLIQVFNRVSE